ncbi:MAG: hypothetical protein Q4C98_05745 [Capnocytophaga sp.]|nr:hypothetical protein [Capnocytophaga sp.]
MNLLSELEDSKDCSSQHFLWLFSSPQHDFSTWQGSSFSNFGVCKYSKEIEEILSLQ